MLLALLTWWLFLSFEPCQIDKALKPQPSCSSMIPNSLLTGYVCAAAQSQAAQPGHPSRYQSAHSTPCFLLQVGMGLGRSTLGTAPAARKGIQHVVLWLSNDTAAGIAWRTLSDNEETIADAAHHHVTGVSSKTCTHLVISMHGPASWHLSPWHSTQHLMHPHSHKQKDLPNCDGEAWKNWYQMHLPPKTARTSWWDCYPMTSCSWRLHQYVMVMYTWW